jgi:hypothetical protein
MSIDLTFENNIILRVTTLLDDKISRLHATTNATCSMSTFEIVVFIIDRYKEELKRNKELEV